MEEDRARAEMEAEMEAQMENMDDMEGMEETERDSMD